jgi:N-acetylgalactosamine kinase
VTDGASATSVLRPASEWLRLLEGTAAPLAEHLRRANGNAPNLAQVLAEYRRAIECFARLFGERTPALLVRSPGRINLLGTHIDHRGGGINPIAVHDMVLVAAPRADDSVVAHSVNLEGASDSGFAIRAELPPAPIADWEAWCREAARTRAGADPKRHWLNYVRAPVLYLADRSRRARPPADVRGMNLCIASTIPMAAGLSSSSALVVGAALAFDAVNARRLAREELVDMCGEAEWYVGTRGGKGDHAAILFGRAGMIMHLGFWPLTVDAAPLPAGFSIVMANSLKEAKKQAGARDAFNQRVASYVIGQMVLKARFADLAPRLQHLRDLNPATLGVDEAGIYRLLKALPVRVGRAALDDLLPDPAARAQLAALYETHSEPPAGYPLRQVVLYAASECRRSEMAPDVLRRGDVAGFAELMNLSHEGDRVTRLDHGRRVPVDHALSDSAIEALAARAESGDPAAALWRQPGGYDASCPELDELVDIARDTPGVLAAGLIGAGLGGAIVILAADHAVDRLRANLVERYYLRRGLTPAVEVCYPVDGASVIAL